MKILPVLFLFICRAAVLSWGQAGAPSSGWGVSADLAGYPYFTETSAAMSCGALDGAALFSYRPGDLGVGFELSDRYLTATAADSNYRGAYNILRGTALFFWRPLPRLNLKFGLGGAWFRSAWSDNVSGIYARGEGALSLALEANFVPWDGPVSFGLTNLFDLVLSAPAPMPYYQGTAAVFYRPGPDWLSFYLRAGATVFFNRGLPRDQDAVTFIWGAGVRLSWRLSPSVEPEKEFTDPLRPVTTLEPLTAKTAADPEIPAPPPPPSVVPEPRVMAFQDIMFFPDSERIKAESLPALESLVGLLLQHPTWRLQLRGYANDTGKPSGEERLSFSRAEAVSAYLASRGVDRERLIAYGLGSLLVCGEGIKEHNRRVAIMVLMVE